MDTTLVKRKIDMIKASNSTMVIIYPNGAQQVIRPNMSAFKGNWDDLAFAVAGAYFPEGSKITYKLK